MPNKSRNHRISLPFQLLKTFTEKELTGFEKLLSSGYLSTNESLNKLLKILKKLVLHHTSFTHVLQCDVYKALYGKENVRQELNAPQSKKLNRLMNTLLKVAEKFLIFEQTKNTEKHNPVFLLPELSNRKQFLLCEKHLRVTEKKLNATEKRGVEYHNQYYNIQKEKAKMLFRNNALNKVDNYDVLEHHTDIKYLLEKLDYHLVKTTLQKRHPVKKFDFKPYHACEALLTLPKYQQNPLIKLYLLNIDLVKKADDITYNLLFNSLQQYHKIIPVTLLKPFYTNLNNFCVIQIANGRFKYNKNILSTYKVMHENRLFVKNEAIDIAILKNIVTVACKLSEFDWANKILMENISYVRNNIRESVFHYNKGIIEFNIGNYDTAIEHFINVRNIDEFHLVSLKATLLQCFYEVDKNYEDYTQQMIESFRIFLTTTKKLTVSATRSYKNFIHYFNRLYNFRRIVDKYKRSLKIEKKLPKLIDSIKNQQFITYKKWLLSKAETLSNK